MTILNLNKRRYRMYLPSLVIIFCLFAFTAKAEENIRYIRLSTDRGLSQSSVMSVLQDQKGFLWIGTQDGLNMFDGYNFYQYKRDPLDTNSLSGNFINTMMLSRNGNIWVGTRGGGVSILDPRSGIWKKYLHSANTSKGLLSNNVNAIAEDKNGLFWIGTNEGLNKFDPKSNSWTQYRNDPQDMNSLSSNTITCLYVDKSGALWIGTNGGGINKFNEAESRWIHYVHKQGEPSLSDNSVRAILEDSYGNLWVGTINGLNKYNKNNNQWASFNLPSSKRGATGESQIRSLMEDDNEILWVGSTSKGLSLFDIKHNSWISGGGYGRLLERSSEETIPSLFEDASGIVWMGTEAGGVIKIVKINNIFDHYYHNPKDPNSLSNNAVGCFYQDKNEVLWIGTWNSGINLFDQKNGTWKKIVANSSNPNSLSSNAITTLYEDEDGRFWIGTAGGGLNIYDIRNNTWKLYKSIPGKNSLSDNFIYTFLRSKVDPDIYWIGTASGGLDKFDSRTEKWTVYKSNPENKNTITSNTIMTLLEDHEGNLWVGTWGGGVDELRRSDSQWVNFVNNAGGHNSISDNTVLSIIEDRQYNIWIATSYGLNKYDVKNDKWSLYSEKDGLCNNFIYGILEDGQSNLWLSTNNGLSRFNPADNTFKNYTVNDGLQGNEYNQGAFYESPSGEMFFGGNNGFNTFYPDKIKFNTHVPPIVVTNFKVYDKPYKLDRPIYEIPEIHLSYHENFFSFEFAALDYLQPFRNQYSYKLEGFDANWINSGYRRYASYTNLDGGIYTFRVRGSNNDGVWNNEGVAIRIIITPPFWKTWWFITIAVFLLAGGMFATFLFRLISIHKQNKRLEMEVAVRTKELVELNQNLIESEKQLKEMNFNKDKFFSIISHDIKNPLGSILGISTLIHDEAESITSSELKEYTSLIKSSSKYLNKLLDNLLNWSRVQTGRVELLPKNIELNAMVATSINLFKGNALQKNIKIINDVREDIVVFSDEFLLDTILRNLISNAIKFTKEEGTVVISTKELDHKIEVYIQDTGIGMDRETVDKLFRLDTHISTDGTNKERGTGLGLLLCKEFVIKNGGEIWVESVAGEGSKFIFTIPKIVKSINELMLN